MISTMILPSVVTVAVFTLVWAISLATRNASQVDAYWGPGFSVIAVLTLAGAGISERGLLLTALALAWGLRLGWHLGRRNLGHGAEDKRYAAMREEQGDAFWWWSLPVVFWLQAAIMILVSLPLLVGIAGSGLAAAPASSAASASAGLTWLDGLGAVLAVIGFAMEWIADRQLARFRANPARQGQVLDTGLWAWSRHPNYFGDALFWWGIFVIALSTPTPEGPSAVWTAIGPALMTFFLTRVSGVPMLEAGMAETRPDYASYRARTSPFLPWPPGVWPLKSGPTP